MPKKTYTEYNVDKYRRKIQKTPIELAEERIEIYKFKHFGGDYNSLELTRSLNLRNLGLQKFPEGLRTLRDIEFIDLSGNYIREVPQWIKDLSSLREIHFTHNWLNTLPDDIGWLHQLKILDLSYNRLTALPETLYQLSLKQLELDGNPGLQIPESLLKGRPEEILRYYFESRDEKGGPLLELKLLLVGSGKVGKTTLLKQLAGEEPDANESETHSIAIRKLTLKCNRGRVRAHAWDFGGQEILHSTHQFFLTERSLYLLVLEPRMGLAQRDAEYWLKLIETQGGRSPTIVVLNWSHGRYWQVDKVKLRRKFPFIVDFIATDALFGKGIEELHRTILKTVEDRMQDVWLPFPGRWRKIKYAVAGMYENFFTYEGFEKPLYGKAYILLIL